MPDANRSSTSERWARLALALLILAGPVLLAWRIASAARTDVQRFPRLAANDVVVVTVGVWRDPFLVPAGPAFNELVARGQRVGPIWAGSDHAPGAAATLWTGRSARSTGVVAPGRRLPPGTWTMASAARDGGARTGAFLAEPLVRDSGLEGFDDVREDAALGAAELGSMARAFLAREPERRAWLWLHLADGGPQGRDAEALLAAVDDALIETGRDHRAILVVTAFSNRVDVADEGRLFVPAFTRLPAATHAGTISRAALSHTDLAHLLRRMLRLPPPSVAAGQAELHGDPLAYWAAMRGGPATSWVWLEGSFGAVLREQGLRAHVTPDGAVRFEALPDPRVVSNLAPLPETALPSARYLLDRRREEAARR